MNTITEAAETNAESADAATALKVAIQGYPGAFHDIAVRLYFQNAAIEIVPADTFEDQLELIQEGKAADLGLMAIENTLAGSIMNNYRLLFHSNLRVSGEIYLRIKQNLLALPGQRIEDLQEVYSHPMAIAQCKKFFKDYPHIKLIETEDTALSAKMICDKKLQRAGAIASTLAAQLYGLAVLAESIETHKKNYTRFLLLQRNGEFTINGKSNKVSLCFSVSHQVGSLHRVLSVMAAYELNLTKIQSIPIAGKQWEYFFFIDFVCDGKVQWDQGIEALRPLTTDLNILGVYQEGDHMEV